MKNGPTWNAYLGNQNTPQLNLNVQNRRVGLSGWDKGWKETEPTYPQFWLGFKYSFEVNTDRIDRLLSSGYVAHPYMLYHYHNYIFPPGGSLIPKLT